MSEKHTPGPWHAVPANNLSGYWQATVHMSQTAQCKVIADTMRETNANARLIAAAPRMYEALELIEAALSNPIPQFREKQRDAMLKIAREVLAETEHDREAE